MNLQDLRTLLDYHYWARDRILKALEPLSPEEFTRELGSSFTSVQATLAHVCSAEWAWHQRWIGSFRLNADGRWQVEKTAQDFDIRNWVSTHVG